MSPAEIGMPIAEVETPALLIDLDAFDRNLRRMADLADQFGVRLRPHAKTHKSPVVALKQMALGAVGQCCQKVGEAEILVAGGVPDVLVTNQIVGRRKIARLVALAKQAEIGVCVDNVVNIADLDAAAGDFGVTLKVLVEIDLGMARCGVPPGKATVALVRAVVAAGNLRFGGLQCYHGSAQHIRGFGERRTVIEKAGDSVRQTLDLLAAEAIDCPIVTGAGTGTFPFEAQSGLWGELQCGSYVFMDADYGRNLGQNGEAIDTFENSLFVYATVMSTPAADRAALDAGLKSLAVDSGLPMVHGLPGVTYVGASDEHGKLLLDGQARPLELGEKVMLVPGHCDPTINLHDWYVGIKNGRVEALWPIAARGASI
jgi:D-serine deaminase-like pyridoxal phosphate-dependent protein